MTTREYFRTLKPADATAPIPVLALRGICVLREDLNSLAVQLEVARFTWHLLMVPMTTEDQLKQADECAAILQQMLRVKKLIRQLEDGAARMLLVPTDAANKDAAQDRVLRDISRLVFDAATPMKFRSGYLPADIAE